MVLHDNSKNENKRYIKKLANNQEAFEKYEDWVRIFENGMSIPPILTMNILLLTNQME